MTSPVVVGGACKSVELVARVQISYRGYGDNMKDVLFVYWSNGTPTLIEEKEGALQDFVTAASMKVFRVASETYDNAWYVKTSDKDTAIKLVREMTEERGWHEEYPEEERVWECEEVFIEPNEIVEQRDM